MEKIEEEFEIISNNDAKKGDDENSENSYASINSDVVTLIVDKMIEAKSKFLLMNQIKEIIY